MPDYGELLERIHSIQRKLRELERSWTLIEPEVFPRCYCGRRIQVRKRGAVYQCPCGAKFLLEDYVFDWDTNKYYVVFIDLNRKQKFQGEYERLQRELEQLQKKYNELVDKREKREKEEAKAFLRKLERQGYRVDEVGDDYVVINGQRINVVFDGEGYFADTDDYELAEIVRELMYLRDRGYL